MKKNKLLTSLMALVLVLGVGACSENEKEVPIEITDPSSLIQRAVQAGNYSMTLKIDEWLSDEISSSDYTDGNYDLDTLWVSLKWAGAYVYDFYYTKEAIAVNLYLDYGAYTQPLESVIYINDSDDKLQCYYSTYGAALAYDYSINGQWQDYFYSLNDIVSRGYDDPSYYILLDSGTSYGLTYEYYNINNANALLYLAFCCGIDWAYSDPLSAYDYLTFLGLDFYPTLEEMDMLFAEAYWTPTDSSYSSFAICEDDLTARFYDIGATDLSDTISACLG